LRGLLVAGRKKGIDGVIGRGQAGRVLQQLPDGDGVVDRLLGQVRRRRQAAEVLAEDPVIEPQLSLLHQPHDADGGQRL
jgi:hypothetical protein